MTASCYNMLGNTYAGLYKFDNAIEMNQRSVKIYEQVRNEEKTNLKSEKKIKKKLYVNINFDYTV